MKSTNLVLAMMMLLSAATFAVASEPIIQPVEYLEEMFDSNSVLANPLGDSGSQEATSSIFDGGQRPTFMSDHWAQ